MTLLKRSLTLMLLVALSWGFSIIPAFAHGFQTAYLDLREQPSGQIDVYWKTPPASGFGDDGLGPPMSLWPIFPEHCTQRIASGEIPNAIIPVSHWILDCGEIGLAQQTITFPGVVNNFV
jgi:hypothetical protein